MTSTLALLSSLCWMIFAIVWWRKERAKVRAEEFAAALRGEDWHTQHPLLRGEIGWWKGITIHSSTEIEP